MLIICCVADTTLYLTLLSLPHNLIRKQKLREVR